MIFFIYEKWIILKVKFSICLRIAYTDTNENAPIFNQKLNAMHKKSY